MTDLATLYQKMIADAELALGYPAGRYHNPGALHRFLGLHINNCGDPFGTSNYRVNTHAVERDVIRFFADLYGLPHAEAWGYVTSGGTEGNLWGLYLARENYPDAIIYASDAAHYSIRKAAKLLRMPLVTIVTPDDGEMIYADLEYQLANSAVRTRPAVIVSCTGTTMTGAIDCCEQLRRIADRSGRPTYIHCDAALAGLMLPFLPNAPRGDFFAAGADSIAVSGHKLLGVPVPCGVAIARKGLVDTVRAPIEYTGGVDATISGSRSGLAALALGHAISELGTKGLTERAARCIELADYAKERLSEIGWDAWGAEWSNIVVLNRPPDSIISRWQLATEGRYAHLITLPHMRESIINAFVQHLAQETRPVGVAQ